MKKGKENFEEKFLSSRNANVCFLCRVRFNMIDIAFNWVTRLTITYMHLYIHWIDHFSVIYLRLFGRFIALSFIAFYFKWRWIHWVCAHQKKTRACLCGGIEHFYVCVVSHILLRIRKIIGWNSSLSRS